MGLRQSVPGPNRTRLTSSKGRGVLPPDGLRAQTAMSTLTWIFLLPACPADFGIGYQHNHMGQFLKITLSLFLHTHSLYISHPIGSVSPEKSGYYRQNSDNDWISSGKLGRSVLEETMKTA